MIAENDADWERRSAPPPPEITANTNNRLRLQRYFWSVAALLLLLVGAGSSVWHTTPESPAYVFDAVQTFEVQGDWTVARVVMYTDHGEPAYRQTRFYQRIGPDWWQTAPDAALWGAQRSLETPTLRLLLSPK